MAHVRYSRVIDAPIADVWAIVRNFGALDAWFPFISQCRLKDEATADQVGAVRANTLADGAVIEETLLEHHIVHSVTEGDVPTKDYSATLALHEVTANGGTYADWSADFKVSGEIEPVASWIREGILATCLNELEHVAQRSGSKPRSDQASARLPA